MRPEIGERQDEIGLERFDLSKRADRYTFSTCAFMRCSCTPSSDDDPL